MIKSRPAPRLLCRKICADGSRCNRPVTRPGAPCGIQHVSFQGLFDNFVSPVQEVALRNRTISGQDYSWKSAEYQDLSGLVARNAGLYQVNLRYCSAPVTAPIFDGADMKQSGLEKAELPGSSFKEADLSEAILDDGDFSGCIFDGAIFDTIHASNANFSGASMRGILARRHAVLYNCNLTNVDARGADLAGTVLSRSDLRGMDMRGATGLSLAPGILECVVYDERTQWPAGFTPPPRLSQNLT